jgi:prepilin-type N-terminal cleavage/methylation domain-containing protein
MRLHHSLLKKPGSKDHAKRGFTLVEILISVTLGSLVSIAATNIMLSQLRSGGGLATTQNLRQEWNRTTHFIESEVALSERIITNSGNINLNQCTTAISSEEFRFALDIRRDLPLAIYYIKANPNSQSLELKGTHSLYRCGPGIDREGNYTNIISTTSNSSVTAALLVDGMSATCQITSSSIQPANSSGKSLGYELCLQGMSNNRYTQTINTYSRISPIFSYPSTRALCNTEEQTIEGFTSLEGTTGADNLDADDGALDGTSAVLICGYGGGDTLDGSDFDDVLEAGAITSSPEPGASLNGYAGSDRLMGATGNDTLNGGDGDDVLISGSGTDILNGGNGDNQYLAGPGTKTITGGTGLDVIYLELNKAEINGLSSCTRSSCSLSGSSNGNSYSISASNVEVIMFRNGRHDITQ